MRKSLVAALVACAEQPLKLDARRFLAGLTADELQFIADYLGFRSLELQPELQTELPREPQLPAMHTREELLRFIGEFQTACPARDSDRKSILLLEYLQRISA